MSQNQDQTKNKTQLKQGKHFKNCCCQNHPIINQNQLREEKNNMIYEWGLEKNRKKEFLNLHNARQKNDIGENLQIIRSKENIYQVMSRRKGVH